MQDVYTNEGQTESGIITYIIFGVWMERNLRVFTNSTLQPMDVVRLVREEIETRAYAFTNDPGDHAV